MSEVMTTETKKRKFSLIDNFVVILLVGYLLLGVGGRLGAELLVSPLHAWLAKVLPDIAATDAWITASVYLRFLGIWIAVLLFLAIIPRNRPILKTLTTKTRGNTLKMFALGLLIGLSMNLFCAFVAMLNGDIRIAFDSFRPVSFLFVFVAVLIQSSAEELIFRVFIYQRLVRRYGKPVLAAVVNAAFFAALHLGNPGIGPLAVLNIVASGLMFSAMIVWMDSPWAAMAAHAAWNFCQNILLGLPNSGMVLPYSVFKLEAATAADSFAYNTAFGLEGTITACVTLIVVTGLIAWWGIKRKTQPTNIWESE